MLQAAVDEPRDELMSALGAVCGPVVDYPSDVILFRQDDQPMVVYWIAAGVVKHVRTEVDRDVIVALRSPRWLLGAASGLTQAAHVTTATTVTRCQLRSLSAADFRSAVWSQPAVSQFVHEMHARELKEQMVRAGEAVLPADTRLARLLARFIRDGMTIGSGTSLRLNSPLSREEIGQMIDVTREHVSRLLLKLQDRGLVFRRRNWLFVPSESELLVMAWPERSPPRH